MTDELQQDQYREVSPSEVRSDEPTFARIIALGGLGLTVLGGAAIIANLYGPRFVGTSGGIVCAFIGVLALLFHAFRDGDIEFRRMYTAVGFLLLGISLVVSILPGKPSGEVMASQVAYYFMPWGPLAAFIALLFLVAAARHETSAPMLNVVNTVFLVISAVCTIAPVIIGIAKPDLLAGPGILLAMVGLSYCCAYFSRVGTADGMGRLVGMSLGLIGGLALFYAVARTLYPPILNDGPRILKTAAQTYDVFALSSRLLTILVLAFGVFWTIVKTDWPGFIRLLVSVGLGITALVLTIGIFTAPLDQPLPPFLVPGGVILGFLGISYLVVSLIYCSDSPFVALTAREVASFFVSPIAYFVLIGVGFASAFGYGILAMQLTDSPGQAVFEPVVSQYWAAYMGAAFIVVMLVPAITMRLFSEEKRTGTLEVLLTAPVGEWSVVLSKFLAAWFFYLIVWLPMGLYLIGLRAAGNPFDYRPLLSYYLCQAVCGAGFVAMGLFFSCLTRNQIIAAVLSFASMFGLLLTVVLKVFRMSDTWSPVKAIAARLDFLTAWQMALSGQLSISFVFVYLSMAVFWLFATVKVLEARRWS